MISGSLRCDSAAPNHQLHDTRRRTALYPATPRRPHDAPLYHLPSALFARREDLGALHGQSGGGHIDWSFLAAGCLDEVSLVVAPVVDATPDAATTFERTDGHENDPAAPLVLTSTEDLGEGTLWLRYNVEAG